MRPKPCQTPALGFEWHPCRTCEGQGEVIGPWATTLGEFRTRCPGVVIVAYAVALSVAALWMFQRRDLAGARGE